MASLLILTGTKKGSRWPLQADKIVLGREAGCDIVIDETMLDRAAVRRVSVSRKHAVVSRVGGDYFVEDGDGQGNKSRNGLYLNERRLPFPGTFRLRHNDRIRLCDFSCTFHDDAGPAIAVEATIDHESSIQTLQAQSAEKLRVILEISNSLSAALEIDSLPPRIVDQLLRLFKQADRCFVVLQDEAAGTLTVQALKCRRAGDEIDARFSASIVWRCLENVQAILGNDLPGQFPESESVNLLPVRSLMCAPLVSQGGRASGAIQLDASGTGPKFTQDDLTLLMGVASQASIALRNARLHRDALLYQSQQQELELARDVHRALLPQGLPHVPGYELFAHYEPALELGGDYYDFIALPGGRLAVLLGDVAGKGVAAALIVVKFSVEARVCLERETDLATAVTKLNTLLLRSPLTDRFVTLVALVLDPVAHTITAVNAGHPSPLLTRRRTGAVEVVAPIAVSGPPLGVTEGHQYSTSEVRLGPEESLFLFSDGITEAMDQNEVQFKMTGVCRELARGEGTATEKGMRLLQAVKRHAAGRSQHDDITLVCFGRGAD